MTEMNTQYNPKDIEGPIFDSWMKGGYFKQDIVGGKDPFVVVIPPPNVTGVLHMGHALNDTIQDTIVRRQRMTGRPTLWVLGTDHAGIATQNKVEQRLAKQGKTRFDVGREAFIEECWKWREEHGSTIVEQIKRMGCSCDYSDEWFTMNESYQKAVRETFVKWWNDGYVYRGNRIINWCPRCGTALADDEVEHEDTAGHLWHIRYPLDKPIGDITHAVIATTRPETMLGDVAIAVHPQDERYAALVGTTASLPLVGRKISIIADEYVDRDFGTGMVKITPAHDPNDFEVGERHNLEKINVMTADAHINELGGKYAGMERYEAREAILSDLEAGGYLVKTEEHQHAVGQCYRCHTVVEPWLSNQWFVDIQRLVGPAIDAVKNGEVSFHPARFANTYLSWMENIRNWCVSRQLWWGHRIPVFYCDACGETVASIEDVTVCPKCGGAVRQDEDVLDTWFSSQLWPFAVFGWPEKSEKLDYFYPTSVLSTARDIINLWVSRMIVAGTYFMDGQVPFSDVIIHPTVLDKQGRRMSKSLGNGIDPIELIDSYGADAMRFGLLVQVTGSQDMKFDAEKLAAYRNFANKIWNASRFVLMNCEDYVPQAPDPQTVADRWILSRLAELTRAVSDGIDAFEFGEVTRLLYNFFWNEFCNWYIEFAKAQLSETADRRRSTLSVLVFVLDKALRLLHPEMPFITEEIWRNLPLREEDKAESLMIAAWPTANEMDAYREMRAETAIELVKAVVSSVRSVRARYGISPRESLDCVVNANDEKAVSLLLDEANLIEKLGNIADLSVSSKHQKPEQAVVYVEQGLDIYIPLKGLVDLDAELRKLIGQREKLVVDLAKFDKKLSNPGFLAKAAPEIVAKDTAKAAEIREQVASVDAQIKELD
ncbi:MAG: valine--tRNA ligase [Coriobacteriia bacterium]|nr:valine--tRNA ligase [Coriobacteriia bacterium]